MDKLDILEKAHGVLCELGRVDLAPQIEDVIDSERRSQMSLSERVVEQMKGAGDDYLEQAWEMVRKYLDNHPEVLTSWDKWFAGENRWFKLIDDIKDPNGEPAGCLTSFRKGNIVLLGNKKGEYFDMTTEMTTGNSFSLMHIDQRLLRPIKREQTVATLNSLLHSFVDSNYAYDPDHAIKSF